MQDKLDPVAGSGRAGPDIDGPNYKTMYEASFNDPDGFWYEHGRRIDWFRPSPK